MTLFIPITSENEQCINTLVNETSHTKEFYLRELAKRVNENMGELKDIYLTERGLEAIRKYQTAPALSDELIRVQ